MQATKIAITCYDKDGNIVKRVTSADTNDVEEPEGEGGLTPNPSPNGEGNNPSPDSPEGEGTNDGGTNNGGGGGDDGMTEDYPPSPKESLSPNPSPKEKREGNLGGRVKFQLFNFSPFHIPKGSPLPQSSPRLWMRGRG